MISNRALTIALAALSLYAQSNATITGLVADQTGAAVAGVKVSILAVRTNTTIETITNEAGSYTQPALPPGDYIVSVELNGFKKATSRSFRADSGSNNRVDLTLVAADSKQVIDVSADPPTLETQNSMLSSSVSERELNALPIGGRNVLDLAMTMPGVVGDPGSDEAGVFLDVPSAGSGMSISGGRAGSSAILADGANATSIGIGRATVTFSPDTVQEVQIITSTFSAKYGNSGGGVVQTVTRAGTDRYRGTAYYFHRNPFLAARTFNRPIAPASRRNEQGITYSGPLVIPKIYNGKGKTWFFAAIEPKQYFDQIDIYDRFPTVEERNGDFRNSWVPPGQVRPRIFQTVRCAQPDCKQLVPMHRPSTTAQYPFWSANDPDPTKRGYVIPKQYFDPLTLKILEETPLPNQPFDAQGRNYFGVRGVSGGSNRMLFKVDHNITPKNRLSVNYREIPNFSDRFRVRKDELFFTFPGDKSLTRQPLLSLSMTLSPRAVNELRASYTFSDYSRTPPGEVATTNFTKEKFGLPNVTDWGYPLFNFNAQFGNAVSSIGLNGALGDYIEHQYQVSDDLTLIKGRHNIAIGGDYRKMMLNAKSNGLRDICCGTYTFNPSQTNSGNANTPGGTGGWSAASSLLGTPNGITLRSILIPYYYRWTVAAAYFQDDYRVRRDLTINMGVRWQFNSPRIEKFNRQATFDYDNPIEIEDANGNTRGFAFNYLYAGHKGRSRFLEPAHYKNFEPRFGFAWQPAWSPLRRHSFVVRGGYGISHPPTTSRGRDPIPDFGVGSSGSWGFLRWQSATAVPARTQGVDPAYTISIGRNPPVLRKNPNVLNIPEEGQICVGCGTVQDDRVPGGARVVFTKDAQSPYVQTWNLTTEFMIPASFVVRTSYMGQKGTHLYSPLLGVNFPDREAYEEMLAEGIDPAELIDDPFGRVDQAGNPLQRPRVDYLRANPLVGDVNVAGLTNANSIYHAGSISLDRRNQRGILVRTNYTWAKSIDTSSDATLNGPNLFLWGSTRIQDAHNLKANRSVSNFDIRHRLNVVASYDLPFGRGRTFFKTAGRKASMLLGNWTASTVVTTQSGFPFSPFLNDSNGIPGGATGTERIRPNVVPGVPVRNPRWSKSVANDVPYFNPEAFARPEFGNLGDAARTLDWARNPWRFTVNATLIKNIYPWAERRRYFELRGEAYNLTNTPVFTLDSGISYSMFSSAPPVCRIGCVSLAGPMPYLWNRTTPPTAGTREAIIANNYNQNFGKLWRDRNGPGRIVQLALKFYF